MTAVGAWREDGRPAGRGTWRHPRPAGGATLDDATVRKLLDAAPGWVAGECPHGGESPDDCGDCGA